MKRLVYAFLSAALLLAVNLSCEAIDLNPFSGAHCFTIGPELDYIYRSRGSGSTMDGFLYGVWGSYDRIHPQSWYYGAEGYWVTGDISGKFKDIHTHASNQDGDIMGKVGFTFQTSWRKWVFIPFAGYGYFEGKTVFKPEKLLGVNCEDGRKKRIAFNDTFQYYCLGFMTWAWLSESVAIGLDFKWKYMNDGQQKINEDPQYGKVHLGMNDKSHYEVDLPLTYVACICGRQLFASVVPFYRFRQYGSMENYPFNFAKTQYHIAGGRFLLTLCF